MKRRERTDSMMKTQEKQVTRATASHPLLRDAQPSWKQWSAPSSQLPPVYMLDVTFWGTEYPFGHLGSAVPAVLPWLHVPPPHWQSPRQWEVLDLGWALLGSNQNQEHVRNIIPALNPEYSTVPATKDSVNFIPAIARTGGDADGK